VDIRRLEVFCKVVEQESFTRAAAAMLLSQPSVSEHVRTLEEYFGTKLVDRLGRSVSATAAGRIVYSYACRIIALREEARQAVLDYQGELAGTLTVGASTIPGAYLLPQLVEGFKRQYSGVDMMLKIADSSDIATAVVDGAVELALVGTRGRDARLEYEQLFADELVLVLPGDHPLACCDELPPRRLSELEFILREPGSGTRLEMERALSSVGVDVAQLRVVAQMGSNEAIRQGVRAGIGAAILSRLCVEEDIAAGKLVAMKIATLNMPRPFYLIKRKRRQSSPLAAAFDNYLHQKHN